MKIRLFILLITVIALSGCTTVTTSEEESWIDNGQDMAEVLVFRGNERTNSIVEAGIGSQSNYVVALNVLEYTVLSIPVGDHTLRVGGGSATSFDIEVSLSQSETTCIQVKGNATQAVAVLVPILVAAIPGFIAEIVSCPSAEQLRQFKKV